MKKVFKTRKSKIILLLIIICILVVIGILIYINYLNLLEKRKINNIKSHYGNYVIVTKKTNLYNKNHKRIGYIKSGFPLQLNEVNIKSSKDTYFNIKNSNYYIYYKDVKKSKKQMDNIDSRYIIFNKNIEYNGLVDFYNKNTKILSINDKFNVPIRYMDDEYYYVLFLNKILGIKKNAKLKIVDSSNTNEEESSYISVINYDTLYKEGTCNKDTCVNISKVTEQLKYLVESGFYTISLDDYTNWLSGNIRLKKNAILLTTSDDNESLLELNNSSDLKIVSIKNSDFKFVDKNVKSTRDNNVDSVPRYVVKGNTSLDTFKKMSLGEDVVEVVRSSATGMKIPVINYHFFYDSSQNEGCNENICLDVSSFREELNYLRDNGYKTLTMDEFTKWMYGEIELPEKSVLLTVDDGAFGTGKHNGNKLIPILEEYNMHATLFLISGWWDVNNYRSKNLDIQSHTFDMHQAGSCGKGQVVCASKEELIADLKKSLAIVDNNNSFCFPFYSYSDLAIEGVKEAGFKIAFVGGNRKASRSDDKYKIPRYPIYKTTTLQQFIKMVS